MAIQDILSLVQKTLFVIKFLKYLNWSTISIFLASFAIYSKEVSRKLLPIYTILVSEQTLNFVTQSGWGFIFWLSSQIFLPADFLEYFHDLFLSRQVECFLPVNKADTQFFSDRKNSLWSSYFQLSNVLFISSYCCDMKLILSNYVFYSILACWVCHWEIGLMVLQLFLSSPSLKPSL